MLTTTRSPAAAAPAGVADRARPQLLHQVLEGLWPARVAQHHVVPGGDGQPRHGAAQVSAADEADRRHTAVVNPSLAAGIPGCRSHLQRAVSRCAVASRPPKWATPMSPPIS